jgi:hypothetical protein
MSLFNKKSIDKYYEKKSKNNSHKKYIIKRNSSCIERKDNIYDNLQKTNKNSSLLSGTNSKYKGLFKDNNKNNNNFNKTTYASLSLSPKLNEKYKKLPLLISFKSHKLLLDKEKEERTKNYQKMRKYRIKLKKTKKMDNVEDQLFKFLHEYGLHYSFSQNKYIIGDKFEYYSKYLPDKFKVNFNSINVQKTKSSSNSKNQSYSNVPSESSKKKSKMNKKSKKKGMFYSTTEEDDDDRMSYKKYMKLQNVADLKFRPRLGDTSYDLVNYIKKIDGIRKGVVNNLINQINNVENRYNIENPREDSRFNTKMQGLYHHKWKNIFSLKDYQELFSENLKGKISSKNYEIMIKNFKDIFLMCFATGNTNFSKVKSFQE